MVLLGRPPVGHNAMFAVNPARHQYFQFLGLGTLVCLPAHDLFGLPPMPFVGIGNDLYVWVPSVFPLLKYKLRIYVYFSFCSLQLQTYSQIWKMHFRGKLTRLILRPANTYWMFSIKSIACWTTCRP